MSSCIPPRSPSQQKLVSVREGELKFNFIACAWIPHACVGHWCCCWRYAHGCFFTLSNPSPHTTGQYHNTMENTTCTTSSSSVLLSSASPSTSSNDLETSSRKRKAEQQDNEGDVDLVEDLDKCNMLLQQLTKALQARGYVTNEMYFLTSIHSSFQDESRPDWRLPCPCSSLICWKV